MLSKFLNKFKTEEPQPAKPERPRPIFNTHDLQDNVKERLEKAWEDNFKNSVHPVMAMDSAFAMDNQIPIKGAYSGYNGNIPEAQMLWYAEQSFIGWQLAAMLAQNWLIAKACLMPAKDATRNGYEITVNNGDDVEPAILDEIRKQDVHYKLNKNMIQFIQMGRIFGIRHALFIVESDDQDYYRKPFNPDGVTPGSYKGISQIDPYWLAPQLDGDAAGNPASINFYEPTWWVVNGKPVHRTHFVIYRTEEVADILKPSYLYGGIPIPQKIAARVYAAERTANEAPMLALTKRTDVIKADISQATAQYQGFQQRILEWVYNRDNYGVKILGIDEDMQQFDTSLSDLDAVIMTQYQLVAAAANVPATKLLGTQPKGFNATGEFEEASYHEELEGIQTHDLEQLLNRHHILLMRSEIAPKFGIEPFEISVKWNELDALTHKEQSEINKYKAETGNILISSGAISPEEERQRIMSDIQSGYNGLNDDLEDTGEGILSDLTGA